MLNTLTKKRGKKGFTLMELLIVVAIIAILVAISIPVFTSQLEKAREATDQANERAAKAVAVATYLTGDITSNTTYYYDAANGKLEQTSTKPSTIKAYGKGHSGSGDIDEENDGLILKVEISASGEVTPTWE